MTALAGSLPFAVALGRRARALRMPTDASVVRVRRAGLSAMAVPGQLSLVLNGFEQGWPASSLPYDEWGTELAAWERDRTEGQINRLRRDALGGFRPGNSGTDTTSFQTIAIWARENAERVRSLEERYHRDLAAAVAKNWADERALAQVLVEQFALTKTRAYALARDQIQRLAARVAEETQRAAGVPGYIWEVLDHERNRRRLHQEYAGRFFLWAEPPPDGHPGHAFNCCCRARPAYGP